MSERRGLLVSGLLTLDRKFIVDSIPAAGDVSGIVKALDSTAPALGGVGFYIATAARKNIDEVTLLSWVCNKGARCFKTDLELARVHCVLHVSQLFRTPEVFIFSDRAGNTVCFVDRGSMIEVTPTREQLEIASKATVLCLAAQSPLVTRTLLETLSPEATVVWAVKGDHLAFPDELLVLLMRRANFILANRAEERALEGRISDLWHQALQLGTCVVSTHGSSGVVLYSGTSHQRRFPAAPVPVADSTGAGDTFAGGFCAAIARGESAETAVSTGMTSAEAFLRMKVDIHEE